MDKIEKLIEKAKMTLQLHDKRIVWCSIESGNRLPFKSIVMLWNGVPGTEFTICDEYRTMEEAKQRIERLCEEYGTCEEETYVFDDVV